MVICAGTVILDLCAILETKGCSAIWSPDELLHPQEQLALTTIDSLLSWLAD